MAVHLNNTKNDRFDFQSQPQRLSIIHENEMENEGGQQPQLFQDTVPLDSPLMESQSSNLDFDTELLEDYEIEVVLDSEDEEINGSRVVNMTKSLPENVTEKRIKGSGFDHQPMKPKEANSNGCTSEQPCVEGSEVSLTNFGKVKLDDELPVCDDELVRLNEWSQEDALGFVDHFVSINNVDLSQRTDYRKTAREKSPILSRAKGTQTLARRINRRTEIKEKGKFEWFENDPREGIESTSGFEGCKHRSVTRHQTAMDAYDGNCCRLGDEGRERKGILSLGKETVDSTRMESDKDGSETAQVSEVNTEVNFAKELELTGKQWEASDIGGNTLDICDIGFNTQIAVEAIESLAYGHPFGYSSADACEDAKNTVDDSSRGFTENAQLKHPLIQKKAYCYIGDIVGSVKRRKRSDRKFCRRISSSFKRQSGIPELDTELTAKKSVKRKNLFAETWLNCSNSVNSNESSDRSSTKPIKRSKAEESLEKNTITVVGNDMISSTIENTPLVNEQSEGHCVKVSTVACRTRQLASGVCIKRNDGQSSSPGENMNVNIEHGILVYRRKRSSLNAKPPKVSSVRGKGSKLCYSSEGVRKNKFTSFPNFDIWSYPRGKRTSNYVRKHPSRTDDLSAPFTSNYQERIEGNAYIKRKTESPSCRRNRKQGHFPINDSQGSFSGKNFDKPASSGSISECGRAVTSRIPLGLALERDYWQTGRPDDKDSASPGVGEEKNHTSIVSSNKTVETCGSDCTTISPKIDKNVALSNYVCNNYHRRPWDKNVPKSSLLKELLNLGVPDHVHKFTSNWKVLRRRKDAGDVRILFSQHLDDDIIKQQKKIAARLGISIAASSMDATHFIADKFARTRNMLEAIALGKPVVTHLWLESCGQASCFIDERSYILRDAKKEKIFGFTMPVSLARANQHPLLKGLSVLITPNIKPHKEMITDLVKAVHGQPVENVQISAMKDKSIPEDLLILSCKEDHSICLPFLKKGAAIYSSELLLNGIVTQKLEYKRHQLFPNDI